LLLGLVGLGLDLAKPKPFSLSCRRVTPRAGDDMDRLLDEEDTAALADLSEARLAICLGIVVAKEVIPSIMINRVGVWWS